MRRTGALALAMLTTLLLLGGPARDAGATAPAYHPSRLTHLGDARQVVVVTSSSWSTSYAVLRLWEKGTDGVWRQPVPTVQARIGARGFAYDRDRRQNSLQTPAGTYTITSAFGSQPAPGGRLPYRRFDGDDWWPYDPQDPRTYNVYQFSRNGYSRWRTSWAERLASYGVQYAMAAVINYNTPSGVRWSSSTQQWLAGRPASTSKGGGIFLHVNGPGSTAGCVSTTPGYVRYVVRWLDPAKKPRIVMGPESVITRV